ncbi:MAG: hypothetical protein WCJ51_03495, partial [Candidatus Moraniibacteriota bacterium]
WIERLVAVQKVAGSIPAKDTKIAHQKVGFCVLGVSEQFHSHQESNAGAIFVSRQKCEAVARQIFATAKI